MKCLKCGVENRDDGKFCIKCGAPLGNPAPIGRAAPPAKPAILESRPPSQSDISTITDDIPVGMRPYLEAHFVKGLRAGEKVIIYEFPATVGRDPGSTLQLALNDTLASTRHAKILFDGKQFIYRDAASTNGTFHKGRPIQEKVILHGDELEFGNGGPLIRFEIPEAVRHLLALKMETVPSQKAVDPKARFNALQVPRPSDPLPEVKSGNQVVLNSPVSVPASLTPPKALPAPAPLDFPVSPAPPPNPPSPVVASVARPPELPPPAVVSAPPARAVTPPMTDTRASSSAPLFAVVKLLAGVLLLVTGIVVALLFKELLAVVGFMSCVILIGLILIGWGAWQLILGIPGKK